MSVTWKTLRPVGDSTKYLGGGFYTNPPTAPAGYEWVEGYPPEGAVPIIQPDLMQALNRVFSSLSADVQADLSPLAAAVKMHLENDNPIVARKIIERAKIPAELEPVRQSMLEKF